MTTEAFPPLAAYLAKLERRRHFLGEERDALLTLPTRLRYVNARDRVLKEGEKAGYCVFLLKGIISRQKRANRTSHIVSLSVPGDAVDLQTLFFEETDHALVAHEPTMVAEVSHSAIIELCDKYPTVAKMLWHDTLVDSGIFRAWAMNVGHRRALQRIGFLFLELEARLEAIGRVHDGAFDVSLTQRELASAVGLSLVHLNKSLRRLREEKLVEIKGREIRILARPRLAKMVDFDPAYLQIHTRPSFDAAKGIDEAAPFGDSAGQTVA